MIMTGQDAASLQVNRAVARLKARLLAIVFGTICGLGLFVMTAWLIIKGGANVGEHLRLLRHFFIGYDVTWLGAFIGLAYGAVVGGVIGWAIGIVYNRIAGGRNA